MRIAATLLACALTVTGCGGSDEPSARKSTTEPSSSRTTPSNPDTSEGVGFTITIMDGKVTPQGDRIDVPVGAEVTMEVTSDADEELHVHSDPEHTFEVKAGEPNTFTFTIDTPGQVAVEAHHLGVTVVQLVVKP